MTEHERTQLGRVAAVGLLLMVLVGGGAQAQKPRGVLRPAPVPPYKTEKCFWCRRSRPERLSDRNPFLRR
jgi:hypothetical protein